MDIENNSMKNIVVELRIIDKNKTLFDLDEEYVIPLYQRAFAWEEKALLYFVWGTA